MVLLKKMLNLSRCQTILPMQQEQDYKMYRIAKTVFLLGLIVTFSAFVDVSAPAINRHELTAPSMMPKKPTFALDKQTPLHPILQEVLLPTKGGLVRGVDFGMTRDQINLLENGCGESAGDYRSRYSIACSIPDLAAFADVVYDFQPDGSMDMVTIDYYLKDAYLTKAIYHDLLLYFGKQYGQKLYTDADGYSVWELQRSTVDGSKHQMALYVKKVGRGEDSGVSIQFVRKS